MEDITPFQSRPTSSGAWGAWLIVGAGASTIVVLAGWLSTSLSNSTSLLAARVPVVWLVAIGMAGLAIGSRNAAKSAFGPRALVFTSMASICALPAVVLGAMVVASRVLVYSRPSFTGNELITGVVMLFAVAVASVVILPIAMLVARRHAPALDGALAAATYAAVAGSVLVAALAAAHAFGRADADTYVASLPKVVALPPFAEAPSFDTAAGRVHVKREGDESTRCAFRLDIDAAEGSDGTHEIIRSAAQSACGRLAIRRDERHDFWVFTNEDGPRAVPILAISGKGVVTTNIDAATVADALGAPVGWIVEAFAAGLAGIGIVLFARRRTSALRALLSATPAFHEGGGMLRIGEDTPSFPSTAAADLPPGSVLLTLDRVGSEGAVRDGATPTVLAAVSGTLESARTALASARAGAHSLALLVVLLATTPLAVAVLFALK